MKPLNSIKTVDKTLKEIAHDMNIMLVEDDVLLQEQLKLFLARFFACVDTASNGEEALIKYEQKEYDLIFTDLTMPYMGGIELSQKIKSINESQHIVVLSAHSESDKLIELINIGVDGFLLKPIDVTLVIKQLTKICHVLYDQKMLKYFSNMLYETNQELEGINKELEKALNEIKYCKVHRQDHTTLVSDLSETNQLHTNNFYVTYKLELEKINKNLENLEYLFNFLLVNTEQYIKNETLVSLLEIIKKYVHELEPIGEFLVVVDAIKKVEHYLETLEDISLLTALMPAITSLFDNLEYWRKAILEYKNTDDIHFMDVSIIEDALAITKRK